MPIRKILPKTESSLQPSYWVTDFDSPYVKTVIQDLKDTLVQQQKDLDKTFPNEGKGVGLASNQIEYPPEAGYPVGFIPPNIYVVSIREPRTEKEGCEPIEPLSVFVNATFKPVADEKGQNPHEISYEEGCLSINGLKGLKVPRFNHIELQAFNEHGKKLNIVAKGFVARVHQHEIDHGLGEEFLNRMKFTIQELKTIAQWIDNFHAGKINDFPNWIVDQKLQCLDKRIEIQALEIWLKNEFKKKEFQSMI